MKAKQDISFTVGAGGLVMVHLPNEARRIYIELDIEYVKDDVEFQGRGLSAELELLYIRNIYLDSESRGFDVDFFRTFPFNRIESLLNDSSNSEKVLERWGELTYADFNLEQTLSHFENRPENKARLKEKINAPRAPRARIYKRPTLEPPTNGLTDAFLEQVAKVYKDARNQGEPPLRHLGELTKMPRESVRYWVKHARLRGFLDRPEKGKVI